MDLADRDRRVVQLVARFKQATAAQIRSVVFTDVSSRTPCDRSLHRLVTMHYLIRVEVPLPGGAQGGSGQYVYALGRRGYGLYFDGKYAPARAVNRHSLAICQSFVTLRNMEREGVLSVVAYATEPDCHVMLGGVLLKPDGFVDFIRAGVRRPVWQEIDMATEGPKKLRGKLESYYRAYQDRDSSNWPPYLVIDGEPKFPHVLWLAIDAERVKELRYIIGQLSAEAQRLFLVIEQSQFGDVLARS